MECKRCGNKDPTYFYEGSKGIYCRKCVGFKRILFDEEIKAIDYPVDYLSGEYNFDYPLTKYQKQASNNTLKVLNKQKDVLLHCVCGAGKTEIVVESISDYLKRGLKVCYAISRREVVIELSKRFEKIFNKAKVIAVYGDHHDELYGDLIVCTTHQLFRYYRNFDLLILDEVDAFPLSGNETLMNISINACKGNIIYSTATLNKFLISYLKKRKYEKVYLSVRPSLKPLIEPKIVLNLKLLNIIYLYRIMKKTTNQIIIFCSSKATCYRLYLIFSKLFNCTYVYSDLEKRNQNIIDFKNKKYQFIFATTVLERGITIKDVDVVILYDRKKAFDHSSLVQMCGRVGRSITNPYGNAYILENNKSKDVKRCMEEIKKANKEYAMLVL